MLLPLCGVHFARNPPAPGARPRCMPEGVGPLPAVLLLPAAAEEQDGGLHFPATASPWHMPSAYAAQQQPHHHQQQPQAPAAVAHLQQQQQQQLYGAAATPAPGHAADGRPTAAGPGGGVLPSWAPSRQSGADAAVQQQDNMSSSGLPAASVAHHHGSNATPAAAAERSTAFAANPGGAAGVRAAQSSGATEALVWSTTEALRQAALQSAASGPQSVPADDGGGGTGAPGPVMAPLARAAERTDAHQTVDAGAGTAPHPPVDSGLASAPEGSGPGPNQQLLALLPCFAQSAPAVVGATASAGNAGALGPGSATTSAAAVGNEAAGAAHVVGVGALGLDGSSADAATTGAGAGGHSAAGVNVARAGSSSRLLGHQMTTFAMAAMPSGAGSLGLMGLNSGGSSLPGQEYQQQQLPLPPHQHSLQHQHLHQQPQQPAAAAATQGPQQAQQQFSSYEQLLQSGAMFNPWAAAVAAGVYAPPQQQQTGAFTYNAQQPAGSAAAIWPGPLMVHQLPQQSVPPPPSLQQLQRQPSTASVMSVPDVPMPPAVRPRTSSHTSGPGMAGSGGGGILRTASYSVISGATAAATTAQDMAQQASMATGGVSSGPSASAVSSGGLGAGPGVLALGFGGRRASSLLATPSDAGRNVGIAVAAEMGSGSGGTPGPGVLMTSSWARDAASTAAAAAAAATSAGQQQGGGALPHAGHHATATPANAALHFSSRGVTTAAAGGSSDAPPAVGAAGGMQPRSNPLTNALISGAAAGAAAAAGDAAAVHVGAAAPTGALFSASAHQTTYVPFYGCMRSGYDIREPAAMTQQDLEAAAAAARWSAPVGDLAPDAMDSAAAGHTTGASALATGGSGFGSRVLSFCGDGGGVRGRGNWQVQNLRQLALNTATGAQVAVARDADGRAVYSNRAGAGAGAAAGTDAEDVLGSLMMMGDSDSDEEADELLAQLLQQHPLDDIPAGLSQHQQLQSLTADAAGAGDGGDASMHQGIGQSLLAGRGAAGAGMGGSAEGAVAAAVATIAAAGRRGALTAGAAVPGVAGGGTYAIPGGNGCAPSTTNEPRVGLTRVGPPRSVSCGAAVVGSGGGGSGQGGLGVGMPLGTTDEEDLVDEEGNRDDTSPQQEEGSVGKRARPPPAAAAATEPTAPTAPVARSGGGSQQVAGLLLQPRPFLAAFAPPPMGLLAMGLGLGLPSPLPDRDVHTAPPSVMDWEGVMPSELNVASGGGTAAPPSTAYTAAARPLLYGGASGSGSVLIGMSASVAGSSSAASAAAANAAALQSESGAASTGRSSLLISSSGAAGVGMSAAALAARQVSGASAMPSHVLDSGWADAYMAGGGGGPVAPSAAAQAAAAAAGGGGAAVAGARADVASGSSNGLLYQLSGAGGPMPLPSPGHKRTREESRAALLPAAATGAVGLAAGLAAVPTSTAGNSSCWGDDALLSLHRIQSLDHPAIQSLNLHTPSPSPTLLLPAAGAGMQQQGNLSQQHQQPYYATASAAPQLPGAAGLAGGAYHSGPGGVGIHYASSGAALASRQAMTLMMSLHQQHHRHQQQTPTGLGGTGAGAAPTALAPAGSGGASGAGRLSLSRLVAPASPSLATPGALPPPQQPQEPQQPPPQQ